MSESIFVVGTGTDVGKTYVTALLVKAMRRHGTAAYYKAAMSGNVRDERGNLIPGDALFVQRAAGLTQSLVSMCPYVYESAYSPHLAARQENNPVRLERVLDGYAALQQIYDYITVEGSGGIMCPLRYDGQELFLADVIRALCVPCVLVADAGLGAINSVVLTVEYMRACGLKIKGLIFNRFVSGDPVCEDNARMCEKLTGIPVVARIAQGEDTFSTDPTFLYE